MKRHTLALATALVLIAPWRQAPVASTATYTVENLGSIDGLVPSVTGMNGSGQVSGFVNAADGTRAVRYTDGKGWEYLPGLGAGSIAFAINRNGDLTGYHTGDQGTFAFRYTDAGGVQDLVPMAGSMLVIGLGINANGDVVGFDFTASGQFAFVARGGTTTEVPVAGLGGGSNACGINDLGQIAMMSSDPSGTVQHALRVEADGSISAEVGSFDGPAGTSSACAIDAQGRLGGQAQSGGAQRAFRFDGQLLNVEGALPSSGGNVEALVSGNAVGEFTSSVDGQLHALLYTDANGAADLNTLIDEAGWLLVDAKGINDLGWIAGDGQLNGSAAAFRLKPVAAADTVAPTIFAVTANPNALLAGKSLVPVTVQVGVTDNVDPSPSCAVTTVDGGAAGDVQLNGGLSLALRSTPNAVYTVHVSCSDASGNTAASSVTVGVGADTTAPAIGSVSASPSSIATPDGSVVPVTISVSASDNVDASPACSVTGVTGGPAGGSSVTGPLAVQVKAASGAVYTVNVRCADAAGNASTASTSVTVATAPPPPPPSDTKPPVIRFLHAERSETRINGVPWENVRVFVFATDNKDRSPECSITSITGGPAGSFVQTGRLTARLRELRSAGDLGRVYQLHISCADDAGNTAQATIGIDPDGRTTYSGVGRHWNWGWW